MPTGNDHASDASDHRAEVRQGDRSAAPNDRPRRPRPRIRTSVLSALLLTGSMTALAACGPNPSTDTASPSSSSTASPPVQREAGMYTNKVILAIINETSSSLQVKTTGDGVVDVRLVEPKTPDGLERPYFREGSDFYTIEIAGANIRAENGVLSLPFWYVWWLSPPYDNTSEKISEGEGDVQKRTKVTTEGVVHEFSFERAADLTDGRKAMTLRIKEFELANQ